VLHAERLEHAHRYQVARAHQGLAKAHRTDELAVVVLWPPYVAGAVLEHHWRIEHHRCGVEPALQRGGVQERLVRRTRHPPGLGGAVELAAGEAETAIEGAQGTRVP